MRLRTRHSFELCLFQYMSSSFPRPQWILVDFSISIARVYRHEICKRQTSALVVLGRRRALCAAAAAGHAAAAIPCFCHCLFALDVHGMAGSGFAAARAAPASRGC